MSALSPPFSPSVLTRDLTVRAEAGVIGMEGDRARPARLVTKVRRWLSSGIRKRWRSICEDVPSAPGDHFGARFLSKTQVGQGAGAGGGCSCVRVDETNTEPSCRRFSHA